MFGIATARLGICVCDSQDDLEQAIENLRYGYFPDGVWPATAECIEAFRDRRRELEYEAESSPSDAF